MLPKALPNRVTWSTRNGFFYKPVTFSKKALLLLLPKRVTLSTRNGLRAVFHDVFFFVRNTKNTKYETSN